MHLFQNVLWGIVCQVFLAFVLEFVNLVNVGG